MSKSLVQTYEVRIKAHKYVKGVRQDVDFQYTIECSNVYTALSDAKDYLIAQGLIKSADLLSVERVEDEPT